jgi:hypothetical protein
MSGGTANFPLKKHDFIIRGNPFTPCSAGIATGHETVEIQSGKGLQFSPAKCRGERGVFFLGIISLTCLVSRRFLGGHPTIRAIRDRQSQATASHLPFLRQLYT